MKLVNILTKSIKNLSLEYALLILAILVFGMQWVLNSNHSKYDSKNSCRTENAELMENRAIKCRMNAKLGN